MVDKSKEQLRMIFSNGDIFEGKFLSKSFKILIIEGTITYKNDRFPPFTGKISKNEPISGKGICYLHHIGI